jgi:hypothetical protein
MTGRRERQLLQVDMERRFWCLWQFFGYVGGEDWPRRYGTPEAALDAAVSEYPVELRQKVRHQLVAVMAENEDDETFERVLTDGFGVNVNFKLPSEARAFAESIESRLLGSIKAHFDEARG